MIHALGLTGTTPNLKTRCGKYVRYKIQVGPEPNCPACRRLLKLDGGAVEFNGRLCSRAECAARILSNPAWRGACVGFRPMLNGTLALVATLHAASLELFEFNEKTRAEFESLWTQRQKKRKKKKSKSQPKPREVAEEEERNAPEESPAAS